MFIIGNNNECIEITDLDEAIKQTKVFADLRHDDKEFKRLDEVLQDYWQNLLTKLNTLKNEQEIRQ